MRHIITLLCLSLLTIAPAFADAPAGLTTHDPYVRAMPPGIANTAAYMTLENAGDKPLRLIAARSDVAERVELHTHLHEGGMMRMREVEFIEIPAKGRATLQPGGLHVMLIGLRQTLEPGQMVSVTLEFEGGGSVALEAPVRRPGAEKQEMQQEHQHHGH
ncbi:MAG: copper chaperone PCu(A)C [Chromatiales bacterium]|jgi:copper(I)-binding protein|nr:copper chaperone PCu(A)C [Chromatiales bacterium]MDX9768124.1 copper chaperone PCu(A)C [Ectothiorhodospiraceae bacterium]